MRSRNHDKNSSREVVRVIPATEIMREFLRAELTGHLEVREHRDGTWTVHYPEEGWIPCASDCKLKHKHDVERPFSEYRAIFTSVEEAYIFATDNASEREVKIKELEKKQPQPPPPPEPPPPPPETMKIEVICGHCENEIPEGSGAVVKITHHGGRDYSALFCDECADVLPGRSVTPRSKS